MPELALFIAFLCLIIKICEQYREGARRGRIIRENTDKDYPGLYSIDLDYYTNDTDERVFLREDPETGDVVWATYKGRVICSKYVRKREKWKAEELAKHPDATAVKWSEPDHRVCGVRCPCEGIKYQDLKTGAIMVKRSWCDYVFYMDVRTKMIVRPTDQTIKLWEKAKAKTKEGNQVWFLGEPRSKDPYEVIEDMNKVPFEDNINRSWGRDVYMNKDYYARTGCTELEIRI